MTFEDLVFDMEDLLIEIEVLSKTFNAVSLQLTEDLSESNGFILYGLESQMLQIEKNTKTLFDKGYEAIRKNYTNNI